MKCSEIEKYLSEYIDGGLNPSIRSQMDEHLSGCRQCREKLESLKAVVRTLSELPRVEAPPDFLDHLHGRLEKETLVKKILKSLFIPFRIKISLELATATALGILIFFIVQPIQKQQILEQRLDKKDVIAKKQVAQLDKKQPAEPAGKLMPEAPAQKSEIKGIKDEESPTTVILSEKKQGYALDENQPVKAMEQSPAEPPDMMADAGLRKEKAPLSPVVISLLVPGEKEQSAGSQVAPKEKAFSMSESSNEPAKENSIALSGAVSPGLEKTEHDTAPGSAPAAPPSAETLGQKIVNLVKQMRGNILSLERDKAGLPISINVEIPASTYTQFIDQVSALGDFESPPPEATAQKDQLISLTIRLIFQP